MDGPPPRLSEAELPSITPPEIVDVRGADGQRGLDLRDGEYERVYSLPDQYTRLMFVALCRQEGVLVYRRPRQRNETLCVESTVWKHRGLEQRFECHQRRRQVPTPPVSPVTRVPAGGTDAHFGVDAGAPALRDVPSAG